MTLFYYFTQKYASIVDIKRSTFEKKKIFKFVYIGRITKFNFSRN